MKNVLITGATGGIGQAIAQEFGAAGYRLLLHYRREEKALALQDALEKKGYETKLYQGEITSYSQCEDIFQRIQEQEGHLDVLINNAGITRDRLILRMTEEEFQSVIDTNLTGAFYMMKLASRMMIRRRKGKILNVASVVGVMGNPGQVNYAASKGGLIAMTKSLAKELARKQIQVNSVSPGFIESPMTQGLEDQYLDHIPLKRLGKGEEVAKLLLYLASEEADYVTGQNIIIDGGLSL